MSLTIHRLLAAIAVIVLAIVAFVTRPQNTPPTKAELVQLQKASDARDLETAKEANTLDQAIILTDVEKSYFPSTLLSHLRQRWYCRDLLAMGEKPIQKISDINVKFIFRFLWLRSFHHPISIRVNKYSDGRATLAVKELSGRDGDVSNHLIKDAVVTLSESQFQQFQRMLLKAKFYDQKSEDESKSGRYDGAQWIFEVNDAGRYHLVDRWSAQGEDRELGIFLLKSASLVPSLRSDIY